MEIAMLCCSATVVQAVTPASTADAGKIRLGGGYRLSVTSTADAGKIRLGGGYRLPVQGN
jgi:hypothetical protein